MPLETSILRPGYLVRLSTALKGNVRYAKEDIERDHVTKKGERKASWKTERTIADPTEHELAWTARAKARNLIANACVHSVFGLLCPESNEEKLAEAIAEARSIVNKFNAKAKLTRLELYTLAGRVAPDDVEAVRAIKGEVRGLLEAMRDGIKNLDAKAVREAASKAKGLGAMLDSKAAERIQNAVATAREQARKIVKAGEQAAAEVDRMAIKRLTEARTAFLDLAHEPGTKKRTTKPKAAGRALDLAPTTDKTTKSRPRAKGRVVELGDAA